MTWPKLKTPLKPGDPKTLTISIDGKRQALLEKWQRERQLPSTEAAIQLLIDAEELRSR